MSQTYLPANQIRWKLRFAVIQLPAIKSRHIWVHQMTVHYFATWKSDHFAVIKTRAKRNCHQIGNEVNKTFVLDSDFKVDPTLNVKVRAFP